jgi:hypothetical protein
LSLRVVWFSIIECQSRALPNRLTLMIENAYSSLSLRPRLPRRIVPPPSVLSPLFSPLLASIARRSCSSSSYAASLLFIVDRRFALWRLDEGRSLFEPLRGDRVPSLEKEAARDVVRERLWYRGR